MKFKKYTLVLSLLVLPFLTHAAYDDVTLETTVILDVGGYELTVSGSSAVVESIEVDETTLTVDLANGSSITIESADRVDLAYDVAAETTTATCTDTESTLTLSVTSAGATTVVVTPSGTCTAESSGGGSSGSSSHRRSSGNSSSKPTPPTTGGNGSLLDLLRDLIQQYIDAGGTPSGTMLAFLNPPTSGDYTRNLTLGDTGEDVRNLQNFLITQNKGPHAQALAAHGATNYFGPLTQAALAEYQASVGITPAVGFFGPVTRAYVNGL